MCLGVCLQVRLCITSTTGAGGGQKMAQEPVELELQVDMSLHVGRVEEHPVLFQTEPSLQLHPPQLSFL